jgi:hypothetical protein
VGHCDQPLDSGPLGQANRINRNTPAIFLRGALGLVVLDPGLLAPIIVGDIAMFEAGLEMRAAVLA